MPLTGMDGTAHPSHMAGWLCEAGWLRTVLSPLPGLPCRRALAGARPALAVAPLPAFRARHVVRRGEIAYIIEELVLAGGEAEPARDDVVDAVGSVMPAQPAHGGCG